MQSNYIEWARRPKSCEILGKKSAQFYEDIKDGLMTKPVKIGDRASAWPVYELHAINKAKMAGYTKDELRALVARLMADRKKAMENL